MSQLRKTLIVLTAMAAASCAVEPVQPWERGNLASTTMVKALDSHNAAFSEHTYTSKEATAGGYGVGAGGCGCN